MNHKALDYPFKMTTPTKSNKEAAEPARRISKESSLENQLEWRKAKECTKNNDATTTSTKENKRSSPRTNKENNIPQLDWREESNNFSSKPVKSKGISPKKFHGSHKDHSNSSRSRPGNDFVKAIHEQSQENVLRERRREISRLQQVKRSAFKEVTSLKTWPLQDLAVRHHQELMQVYLGRQNQSVVDVGPNECNAEPDYTHGASSESAASTDKKCAMRDKSLSPGKSQQKQQYKSYFLEELSIPNHNVVTPSVDPATRFDPGLWSMEPRIFSTEKAKGKRRYLVGHMGRVADHILRKTDRCSRHFYELIREDTPCRLYFDLEYSIPDNPDIPGDELLEELYRELADALQRQFPHLSVGFDPTCIVDLDSSTPQKFSRHWIVHLPSRALFKNSLEVGKFVKAFIQRLADQVATEQLRDRCPCLQEYLFVHPAGTRKKTDGAKDTMLSKKTCFVDLGVYTRNRLFRLLGSSKFGKSHDCALRFAGTNQFPLPRGFGNEFFHVPDTANSEAGDSSGDEEEEKFKALTDWYVLGISLTGQMLSSYPNILVFAFH
jgi:hypothetical protein